MTATNEPRTDQRPGRRRARTLVWLLSGAALAAVAAVGVWTFGRTPAPRLVILYATCTLNRNYLSPYNPHVPYTPSLEQFANGARLFTKHQTEEGQSGIAFASLVSGNQAWRHGVYYHPNKLSESLYLIGEAFRDGGYDTFYWANHAMASPELNYAQGIPSDHIFGVGKISVPPKMEFFLRAQDPTFKQILKRLHEDPSYRVFLMTTFSVTHAPYHLGNVGAFCAAYPAECGGLTMDEISRYVALYYQNKLATMYDFERVAAKSHLTPAEVAKFDQVLQVLYKSNVTHLDRRFGELIDAIKANGLLDETVIVFTADHGEVLDRSVASMRWTHGFTLSAEDLVVPLIVYAPGVAPGRFEAVSRSIDIFPTLAGLAKLTLPEGAVTGVDLSPALHGQPAPRLLAYSHSSLLADGMEADSHPELLKRFPRRDPTTMWVALRDGDAVYKLTDGDGSGFAPHVYDWTTNPDEERDLYDPNNPEQAAALKLLKEYKAELVDGYQAAASGTVPTDRQREILRSLGYIK